ncbi:MAG TPA: YciI family protein [Povalibacter sp.]|nr:YciI family protein [Povalibacter sp.]
MKVMVFMKATEATENAALPTPEALQAMHDYNEALVAAGILKDQVLGGLLPTRFAKRVRFSGKRRTVTDGPFTETKEVIAGFALWEVKSMEEALEWVMKSPNTMQTECDVEIRPLYSPETWDPV